MKIKLALICLSLFLFNCDLTITDRFDSTVHYLVVSEIHTLQKNESNYRLDECGLFGKGDFHIMLTDSTGKFKIGDTLKIVKN